MQSRIKRLNSSRAGKSVHHPFAKGLDSRWLAGEQVSRKLTVAQHGVADLRRDVVVEPQPGEVLQAEALVRVDRGPFEPRAEIPAATRVRLEELDDRHVTAPRERPLYRRVFRAVGLRLPRVHVNRRLFEPP